MIDETDLMTDTNQSNSAGNDELEKEIAQALGDFSVMDLVDDKNAADQMPSVVKAEDINKTKGTIVAIHDDDVFVDLGGKSQGIVSLAQFETKPELGAEMEFVVEGVLGDEGLIKLSRKGAVEKATWQSLERGMVIEARVTGSNTGGLELKVAGQRAFMPASQVDLHRVENMNEFLNQKLKCQVIELDRRGKKIVLSRRAILAEEQKVERAKILEQIAVDQILEGKVRNIQQFGAFVDLGGVDGLVHVSDLRYERVNKVEDVVKVGDTVRVKVLKIENDGERISLGMKQVGPDPWDMVQAKYAAGSTITGPVTKLASFGAFVELEPGVEGLIPISEMSWDRIAKPSQVVKTGEQVSVKVLEVDANRQRLTLSIKQMSEDPWGTAGGEFAEDSVIEGTVTRIAEFGAFVEIKPGVEGMIHISELADKRVATVEDVVKVGQQVQVKVLNCDTEKHRIALSIKALTAKLGQDRGRGRGKVDRTEMKKYVIEDHKKPSSGDSLGSLMEKFGGDGGLKGGLG